MIDLLLRKKFIRETCYEVNTPGVAINFSKKSHASRVQARGGGGGYGFFYGDSDGGKSYFEKRRDYSNDTGGTIRDLTVCGFRNERDSSLIFDIWIRSFSGYCDEEFYEE